MDTELSSQIIEISPRFRRSLEERVARLERDAGSDEDTIRLLRDADHIRRQRRLVAVQLNEAVRIRAFLDCTRDRLPRPLIAL